MRRRRRATFAGHRIIPADLLLFDQVAVHKYNNDR